MDLIKENADLKDKIRELEKDSAINPWQKWVHFAQTLDAWRIFPRAFIHRLHVPVVLHHHVVHRNLTHPHPRAIWFESLWLSEQGQRGSVCIQEARVMAKIRMIAVRGDRRSDYYSAICVSQWRGMGYDVEKFDATTPETLGDELTFAERKFNRQSVYPNRTRHLVQSLPFVGVNQRTHLRHRTRHLPVQETSGV